MSVERDEETAAAVGRLLRSAADDRERARRDAPELRRRDAATRQRLVAALGASAGPRSASPSWWSSLATAPSWRRASAFTAAIALAAVATFWFLRSPALDYHVSGAPEVAGYIRAESGAATVAFEEGSQILLAPGASGRVSDVRSNGARFILEDGAVDATIAKRAGAAWSVHAGPWEVRVTGTAFAVQWDARRSALRVAMREGSVIVHGPGAEAGIGLRAGQSLEVGAEGTIRVASASDPPSAADGAHDEAPPAGSPPAVDVASTPSGAPSAPLPGSAEPAPRPWPARVAAGDYDGVLTDAEARGIDVVLGAAPATDLAALSDAARYRGRSGLATRALQSLRDRFRGTPAAANAAFLLGRMADDAGSAAAAIRWYDAHLAEGGAFAAEAMGRKMLAVRRSSGEAAAATIARSYLDRFPGGAHAAIARTLLADGAAAAGAPAGAPSPPDPGVMPTSP